MQHTDFRYWMPIAVRWSDMDTLGHVNNAVYFTYIETARLAYFNTTGVSDHWQDGYGPILARITCDFRQPIVHPAKLEAGVRVCRLGKSSMSIETLLCEDSRDNVVASSEAVVVWVHYASGKSKPLSPTLRQALIDYEPDLSA